MKSQITRMAAVLVFGLVATECGSPNNTPRCGSQTSCDGTCMDLDSDANNCGKCGHQCGEEQQCRDSRCVDDSAVSGSQSGATGATGRSGGSSGATGLTGKSGGSGSSGKSGASGATGASGNSGRSGGTGGSGSSGQKPADAGNKTDAPVDAGGGSPTTMCATAFFSAKAQATVAEEYSRWKAARIKDCPQTQSAVVSNGGGVFSEGIGYGMLLTANADDQATFDKLWKFYSDHLDPNGLMNWQMDECAAPGNNNANAASDGDLDAAMGLVRADAAWGGYREQALGLIQKIKEHETDVCAGLNVLRPGDKFGGCRDGSGRLNPSYFAPGYYRVFATIDTANAEFWRKLADDSYVLLTKYQSAMGGLVSEWSNVDGRIDGDYGYNACRTPWRVATDYQWFCTPEAKAFLEPVVTYVDGKGGVPSVPFDKNSAFLGAFALSAVATSQAKLDGYVDAWLGAKMDDTPYFQATLRVLYLQTAAGKFTP